MKIIFYNDDWHTEEKCATESLQLLRVKDVISARPDLQIALELKYEDKWEGNPKGKLQELVQQRWKESPVYEVIEESGPSHERTYTVETCFGGHSWGQGSGSSKRKAEIQAAESALDKIENGQEPA